jgi:hypothetical protein
MAALGGIAAGKAHEEFVAVPGYGQLSKIFYALNNAAKYSTNRFTRMTSTSWTELSAWHATGAGAPHDAHGAGMGCHCAGGICTAGKGAFAWCMTREVFGKIKMPVLEPWK